MVGGGVGPARPAASEQRNDIHPVWTWISLVGLAVAVLLAIVGLPPIDIHGPLHYLGVMDPLCGGTRSVYLTLHGQLREAMRYNPAGPLLLVLAAALVLRAVAGRLTGYWMNVRVPRRILIPLIVLALIALQVNQQLHVDLLTAPWTGL
jgi:uncharacterized membrane protein YfcA